MNTKNIRLISIVLILSILLTITSCGKNSNKDARKITEDDPWFDADILEVDTGADEGRPIGALLYPKFIDADDKYYYVETYGDYQSPPDYELDLETYNYRDYQFDYLAVIDRNDKHTINTIDLRKDFTLSEYHIDNVYYKDGHIIATTPIKEREYDVLTGKLLDTWPRKTSDDYSFSNNYLVGDYEVETVVFQTETNQRYSIIRVTQPDGTTCEIELKRADKNIYIHSVLAINETKALILASVGKNVGKENVYYELDLTTNELTIADNKDYEWLEGVTFYDCVFGSDGTLYFKDYDKYGIFRINANQKKAEEILNFSWCSLNSALLDDLKLVECSEDHIVLCGFYDATGAYEGRTADKMHFIELTRADKNPHKGKTVLELFSPNRIENYTGEAISVFNETNGKYFIEFTTNYDMEDFYDDSFDENNYDIDKIARLNTGARLSNKLAIDIMNGEGPDILMDVSGYNQLNNSNCLADLTPFIKDADPDKYFTNIIEGSKTDGAIYQLPISFYLEGIMTKASYSGSSGKGFTLEEYAEFTDKVMNGKDPILYGQATYFSMLFSSVYDEFINNGKVDLSKSDFKILADYVRDNVRETGTSHNEWYQSIMADGPLPKAVYEQCTGIGGFVSAGSVITNDMTMLGIPSVDGRGPRFTSFCSVAVSSQAVDVDACGEFVKILISDEIQTIIAMNDSFVINRNAFREAGEAAITYYNNGGSSFGGGNGFSTVAAERITLKDIENIENVILSCSRIKSEDSDISIILIEEMPPYFLGQKDLDAVIKIAQDRIQKVLDERG